MSNKYRYNHMTLFIVPTDSLGNVTDHNQSKLWMFKKMSQWLTILFHSLLNQFWFWLHNPEFVGKLECYTSFPKNFRILDYVSRLHQADLSKSCKPTNPQLMPKTVQLQQLYYLGATFIFVFILLVHCTSLETVCIITEHIQYLVWIDAWQSSIGNLN